MSRLKDIEELDAYQSLPCEDRAIVDQLIANPKMPRYEIAKVVGCSPKHVYRFIQSDRFLEINEHLALVKKATLLQKALDVFESALDSKNPNISFKAAMAVLTDAGVFKPEGAANQGPKNITVVWNRPVEAKEINASSGQLPAPAETT